MSRFALFYHSVISDWNHGNAHFLRGLMRALQARGHSAICYEPADAWSLVNLLRVNPHAIDEFTRDFPDLAFERYAQDAHFEDWARARLQDADAVLVHEWSDPSMVRTIRRLAEQQHIPAYFHDTHYRVVLDEAHRDSLELHRFSGILAYSPSVAERYRALGFQQVHVFHEAADTTVFQPLPLPKTTDVVFVGNYGDGDRSDELEDYVFGPRPSLPALRFAVYGVRYPPEVVARLNNGLDINYGGWLPNVRVPSVYSATRVVLHVPRRQYVELLPGTPTIRVFEALASGACLISLPWEDRDHLFDVGRDYLVARTPDEMRDLIGWLCSDDAARERIGQHGRQTILERHTCAHRADQLLQVISR